jgi:hypothetical protein
MPTIEDLYRDIKGLKATLEDAVERGIIGDGFDIAEINREQLNSGLDANGERLGSYTETTKKIRQKRGLQTEFIDLNFTGHSQKTITTEKNGSSYALTANPRWDEDRFKDAIGISEDNEQKVTDIIILNIESELDRKFT